METHRDRQVDMLFLSQKNYIEKVIERFCMRKPKVSTQLAAHFKLSAALSPQSDEEKEHMIRVPYASVVGSLMDAFGVYSSRYIS